MRIKLATDPHRHTQTFSHFSFKLFCHRFVSTLILILLLSVLSSTTVFADELAELLDRVAALNISRGGYTLGTALTDRQNETARQNTAKDSTPGTNKFRDKNLYVVVDQKTDRVVIIFEHYESASSEKISELVGALFFDFGDPTIMAHDKIVYWVFNGKGKLSKEDYDIAKKTKELSNILLTIKLNSDLKISGNNKDKENGNAYYIISSEPILRLINAQNR